MIYLGFSFAVLDSLVPYAAVLSVARQRFVDTLLHVKKLERLPSSPSTLFFEQASLFLLDPLDLLLLICRIVD